MVKTRQQIGRMSRNKGKRFERQCREMMHSITGWPYWKRTQRGDLQLEGDLVACTDDSGGVPISVFGYYVECKARASLSCGMIMSWYHEALSKKGRKEKVVLLCKQDRGVVLAVCSWEQDCEEPWMNARIY